MAAAAHAGERIGCLLLTETEAGSDVAESPPRTSGKAASLSSTAARFSSPTADTWAPELCLPLRPVAET